MKLQPDGLPRLLSVKEAARALRVGHTKVYRLAHEGKLDGFDIAGSMRIGEDSIARYLESMRVGPRRIDR